MCSPFTCVSPCWPAAVASLGTAVMILPGVPVVITFVVRIVMGVFMPALLVTPAMTKAYISNKDTLKPSQSMCSYKYFTALVLSGLITQFINDCGHSKIKFLKQNYPNYLFYGVL